jgi:diguanylate cyclase (GGDEF)-like protein
VGAIELLAEQLLGDLLADFRIRNLGSDALRRGYVGVSIAELRVKYCTAGNQAGVDFDLALKHLEESGLVKTGPLLPYKNDPGSLLVAVGSYSAREFLYLTEKGYKASQKSSLHANMQIPVAHNQLDDRLPLYRRKAFDDDLPQACQEATGGDGCLSLIMMDIDQFKAINDTHLHIGGDIVLLGVAKVVDARIKGKGKAYRYGGDEFALLLPNYTTNEATAFGETIRKQIEQSAFGEKRIRVTASLGVAVMPDHAKTFQELLKAADAALYRAKELGRNLVRISRESEAVQRERSPVRKAPKPGTLTDDERESIRLAHFSGAGAKCPRDGVPLQIIKEMHEVGTRGLSIIVLCPICGFQDVISAPR